MAKSKKNKKKKSKPTPSTSSPSSSASKSEGQTTVPKPKRPEASGKNPWLKNVIGVTVAVAIGLAGGYAILEYRRAQNTAELANADSDDDPRTVGGGIPRRPERDKPKNLAYIQKDDPTITTEQVPPAEHKIIDIHEHVVDEKHAMMLLEGMDKFGIERSCLIASSWYTFTLDNQYGFERYKENNEELIRIRNKYPDRFCAFITIHPPEDGNLELIQDYVKRGADGVKLYLGHGAGTGHGPFHMMPLDDPRMMPIYAWAEEVQLPFVFHINLIKYFEEFVSVMEQHPYLRVNVPHFGLHKNTGQRLARFAWLLERYPNIYTDISFGWWEFHIEGFEALAKWRTRSHKYFTQYADRIMYGSDMVIERTKNQGYIDNTLRSYRKLLETKKFRFFLEPDFLMHGLNLSDETLEQIYVKTPSKFLILDKDGKLPDRSQGWPPPGWEGPAPGVPPAVEKVEPLPEGTRPWLLVAPYKWKDDE